MLSTKTYIIYYIQKTREKGTKIDSRYKLHKVRMFIIQAGSQGIVASGPPAAQPAARRRL